MKPLLELGVLMLVSKISWVALLSMAVSLGASAALFDTIDSVETIQKVAAQNQKKMDRMPASKATEENEKAGSEAKPEKPAESDSTSPKN